eukprot:366187-Chlamydomonas_euryale.AAC.3
MARARLRLLPLLQRRIGRLVRRPRAAAMRPTMTTERAEQPELWWVAAPHTRVNLTWAVVRPLCWQRRLDPCGTRVPLPDCRRNLG